MSTKRGGLFGGRPELLLVDEKPPGIELPELMAASLPELEEEPEEDLPPVDDDTDDEDSYDGGGPLRIFIGSPAAAPDASASRDPIPAVDKGPVWDASALAIGAGEDELDDSLDEDSGDRAPVLIRPPAGAGEPPPLTMSFGGSFSRGSMDAGVMDDEDLGDANTGSGLERKDTIVVRDEIYDRLLRFDDAALSEPDRAPRTFEEDSGAMLPVGEADEVEFEIGAGGFSVDAVPGDVEPGAPPARGGLTVGFVPGDALRDHEDEDDGGDDDEESLRTIPPAGDDDDAPRAREEETEDFVVPSVSIGVGQSSLASMLSGDAEPPPVVPRAPPAEDALVLPPPSGSDGDPGDSRTTPEWAVRRRESRADAVRTAEEVRADEAEEDGGGSGLRFLIFAIVAVLAVVLAWLLVPGKGDGAVGGGARTMTPIAPAPPQAEPAPEDPATAPQDAAPEAPEAAPAPEATPEPAAAGDAVPTAASTSTPTAAPQAEDLGLLRVRATRPARVYIDGELVGETPMSAVSLSAGEHEIKVVAIETGQERRQSVRIDAGRAQEVRFPF